MVYEKALQLKEEVLPWLEKQTYFRDSETDCEKVLRMMNFKKEQLTNLLLNALKYVEAQNEVIDAVICGWDATKNELIQSQQRVVRLQDELLASKSDQLQSLQSTGKASVENSVKAEFVSYSAMAHKNLPPSPVVPINTLRTVVKTVVQEEDRSRSVLMFGLPEESDELLCDKVADVLGKVGVKPRFEACRLGKARAVKISLSNTADVNTILLRARVLKESVQYSAVFFCPERIHNDISNLKRKSCVVESSKNCYLCDIPLLTRSFYVFPCSHMFHTACLVKEITQYLSKRKSEEVSKIYKILLNLKDEDQTRTESYRRAKSQLDEIIAEECLMCGEYMIQSIDTPFLPRDEDEFERLKQEWS